MAKQAHTYNEDARRRIRRAVERTEHAPPAANVPPLPAGRCAPVGQDPPWMYGEIATTWTAADGNTLSIYPCDEDGGNAIRDTWAKKTIYIRLPRTATWADGVGLTAETVVAYLPYYDKTLGEMRGVLYPPPAFSAGMIMMWSGTPANLPGGWALCDGGTYCTICGAAKPCASHPTAPTYTTVDLRGRFIVGYYKDGYPGQGQCGCECCLETGFMGSIGDYSTIGSKGGIAWHGYGRYKWDDNVWRRNYHPDHKDHTHAICGAPFHEGDGPWAPATVWGSTGYEQVCGADADLRHGGIFNAWPGPTDAPLSPTGEAHTYADTDNRPPYFVLAFIERIR